MKNLTLLPLQSFRTKIAGIVITLLSVISLILIKATHFSPGNRFNEHQVIQCMFLLIITGLFFITFSEERIDDDRVKLIRGKALQCGFAIILAIIISLIFVSVIQPSFSFGGVNDLSLIALTGLVAYQFIFNISLYIDANWNYNNETVLSNIKKNRTFFLIYTLGLIAFLVFLFFV